MSATLNDIARDIGVSESTVSRALRGDPRVADRTIERVRAAAERLAYMPNLAARELASGSTHLIGLVVGSFRTLFFNRITEGAMRTLTAAGYDAIMAMTEEDSTDESRTIERLMRRSVQGFIVQPGPEPVESGIYAELARRGLPVIFVGRSREDIPHAASVLPDNAAVGRAAGQRFRQTGRKRVAIVMDPDFTGTDWRTEMQGALETELNGPVTRVRLDETDRFLSNEFDGAFCLENGAAIHLIRVALNRGKSVPDSLAVISYGNKYDFSGIPMKLTTVSRPEIQMGVRAGELFLELMNGKDVPQSVTVPVTLHTGDSG